MSSLCVLGGHWKIGPPGQKVSSVTGKEQRAVTNSSRKNEVAGPKQKQHSVVDGLVVKVKSNAIKINIA